MSVAESRSQYVVVRRSWSLNAIRPHWYHLDSLSRFGLWFC